MSISGASRTDEVDESSEKASEIVRRYNWETVDDYKTRGARAVKNDALSVDDEINGCSSE